MQGCFVLFPCNVHLKIASENKQQPTRAFGDGIINFRKKSCLCKAKAMADQASWKEQRRGRGKVLFDVHGSLRELPPVNLSQKTVWKI
ncbi:hypothetical protein TNCV_4369061 [Trichonephila clavipes]|nr:hypothetical protein TNCV_4369061 [Trichonephila clavipes]